MRQGRSDICGRAGHIYAVVQVRYMRQVRSDICGRAGQIYAVGQVSFMWQGRAGHEKDFTSCSI